MNQMHKVLKCAQFLGFTLDHTKVTKTSTNPVASDSDNIYIMRMKQSQKE